MAVNVKLGVDLGSFNQNINQAKQQIKSFDAALKYAESSFKATGDAEAAMTTKTQALNGKLQTQKKMVEQYSQALQQMRTAGVDPMNASYTKLQTQMLNAQAAMMDTQAALNGLDGSQKQAATSADKLTNSVNSIGKKISLDQVIGGINKITDGLENAGKKALQLGEQIFSAVMDKARWADDSQTMALMYGIPLERFLQMQKLVQNGMDTSVDAILGAQSRLAKGIGGENKAAMESLRELGVSLKTLEDTGDGILEFVDKDPEETFFEIGRALMEMDKAYDKENAAQALFGKSWKELVPLFKEYKTLEEYNAALENTKTASEEDVNALAELNDKVDTLKGNLETLSTDILAQLAPALSEGADALNGLLESLLEYLEKPEGKQMLADLGTAVSGLFENLGDIDPEAVVSGFTEVFTKITGGVQWLVDNRQGVVDALKYIVEGWALLKLTGGALEILKLINGINGLNLFKTSGNAVTTGINGTQTTGQNAGMAAAAGTGAMILINYDPLTSLEYQREYGKRAGVAKYIDSVMGSNLYELQQEWEKTGGGGGGGAGRSFAEEEIPIEVVPEVPENSAEDISKQIGVVTLPAHLQIMGGGIGIGGGGYNLMEMMKESVVPLRGFANGIPYVPDTMLAWLHKGETVTPAREVSSRNYSSNLYVERMIMNNGTDAAGLADAMAAAQRRTMSGYGS